jgi:LPXTG-motif cell wall-anchored protein
MKKMKKTLALVLALVMALALAMPAYASKTTSHTITIDNSDQNVSHSYEAYQVFKGNLDADENTLSDIEWGNGVNSTALLAALQASTDPALGYVAATEVDGTSVPAHNDFKDCTTAADVAKVLENYSSTNGAQQNAGAIDAVATIIAGNLAARADTDNGAFAADSTGKKYVATVTGDGYYFIKDVTTTLKDDQTGKTDTLSKYLLEVVKNTTINAKDTGLNPDKKIDANSTKVAANSAAMGDTVNFEVTIDVPNTAKYEDHFVFIMNDQLPAGLTFTGITSVEIAQTGLSNVAVNDLAKAASGTNASAEYLNGTNAYYTLKIGDTQPTLDGGKYAWEADGFNAVTADGGQKIVLVFDNFKKVAEVDRNAATPDDVENLIGGTITIKYTAVVNDDASYKPTGNVNEVTFDYSNDPNHDYSGDTFDSQDPKGTTPVDKTQTYTTKLIINKVDDQGTPQPLAGATFTLTGTALNTVLQTGEKFETVGYVLKAGEKCGANAYDAASPYTIAAADATYWALNDGTYTTQDPNATGMNQTQYKDTTTKYALVSYSKAVTKPVSTVLTATTDANGQIIFEGLNAGTYTLEETIAPAGFNLDTNDYKLQIAWTDPAALADGADGKTTGGFTVGAETTSITDASGKDFAVSVVGDEVVFQTTIQNLSGATLPSTGGIGTKIFYALGAVLVVGAGAVLVSRKRVAE